jgi:xanthine/uracil permease
MVISGSTFMVGMGAYFLPPAFLAILPPSLRAILGTGLIAGTMVGIVLFLVFKTILRVDKREEAAAKASEAHASVK